MLSDSSVVYIVIDGGCSSVVRESEFKSKDPRFDPLAGQSDEQFLCLSETTLVHICLYSTPLRVYGKHPSLCAR